MNASPARVGSTLVDSLPYSQSGTEQQAAALKASGAHGLAGYLGVINASRVAHLLDAGMAFLPVTLAGEYEDGPKDEVAQLQALGLPADTTVFLDLEGMKAFRTDPPLLITKINTWADAIAAAGFMPGLYVGVPQPLTGDELYALKVKRYWKGQGSTRDRYNNLIEPTKAGWCITQMYPSLMRGDTWVDCSMVGQDYKGRVPNWVTG